MIRHVRGEDITFVQSFFDEDGLPTTVPSADVSIDYHTRPFTMTNVILPMVQGTDLVWRVVWQSGVSEPGTVYWSIRSGGTGAIAEDGMFILEGNAANVTGF